MSDDWGKGYMAGSEGSALAIKTAKVIERLRFIRLLETMPVNEDELHKLANPAIPGYLTRLYAIKSGAELQRQAIIDFLKNEYAAQTEVSDGP